MRNGATFVQIDDGVIYRIYPSGNFLHTSIRFSNLGNHRFEQILGTFLALNPFFLNTLD